MIKTEFLMPSTYKPRVLFYQIFFDFQVFRNIDNQYLDLYKMSDKGKSRQCYLVQTMTLI